MFVPNWFTAVPSWVTSLNFIGVLLVIGALAILLGPPIAGKIIMVRKHRGYEQAIRESREHRIQRDAFFAGQPSVRREVTALPMRRELTAVKPPRGFLELSADYEGIDYQKIMPASERHSKTSQKVSAEVAARALQTPTEEYRIYEAEIVEDTPLSDADRAFLADPLGSWVLPPERPIDLLPTADETFRALIERNWGNAAAMDIDTEWHDWNLYSKEEALA